MNTLTDAPSWHAQAACQDEAAELFYEVFRESVQDRVHRQGAAKRVCATCPVRAVCLEDALADAIDDQAEVRGGMTAHQRRTLLQERAVAPPPPVESDLPGMRRGRVDSAATLALVADMRAAGHTLADIAQAAGMEKAHVKRFARRKHATVATEIADALASAHTALMKQERRVAA